MNASVWRPGVRVARLRATHSYGSVLGLVFLTFVFAAAAPASSWAQSVLILLQTTTLCMALWTSGLGRLAFLASAGLAVIAVAAVIASLVGGDSWDGAIGLLQALILIATCGVIAFGVLDQGSVNAQSVLGAVSVYLLLGMFFTMIYGAVAVLGSGHLFAQGTDGTLAVRMYFSYVTMTTVGYGDYTTSGNLAHTISIVEALFGQLYLVVVLAVLVSRLAPRRGGD